MGAHRKSVRKCRNCGSEDLWRVGQGTGIVAAIMRFRGLKPLQCRACRWICYIAETPRRTSTPQAAD